MKIAYEQKGKIGIINISGRLDASNSSELKESFLSYLGDTVNFVLNCSELEFIDSTGLGAIISILKRSTEKNGDIVIANLQQKPAMLFEITRAYKIFEVFDDLDKAVEALKKN
ncbi:MAG: anti-sigma factor antagonist [Candidatus Cloacimonadota bacterium]|nr:MAG: anti-sigma factor antagonist [Candidatus Cloacimonadota bacterium]HHE65263.1 anti-sigma factor antagonist [Bacteroidota bacterium]